MNNIEETKFTREHRDIINEGLLGVDYFDYKLPRREKKSVTDVPCPLCDHKIIFIQKGPSYRLECPKDGHVGMFKGF